MKKNQKRAVGFFLMWTPPVVLWAYLIKSEPKFIAVPIGFGMIVFGQYLRDGDWK